MSFFNSKGGYPMTLRHMSIFLEVAACNNMSIAAQNLYLSQSTVSLAISEIEKTYKVRLFDRLSKHLRLTEAGMLLLDYASRIISLYKEMESALLGLHLKQIHIGSTLVAASCLLQDIIRAYHIICPDVSTRFTIDDSYFMEKKLAQGELDVMLTETKGSHSSLVYTPFLDDTFVVICSPMPGEKIFPLRILKMRCFSCGRKETVPVQLWSGP